MGSTETASFSADGNVTDGEDWTYYEYSKTSDNVGVITYTFANARLYPDDGETLYFQSFRVGLMIGLNILILLNLIQLTKVVVNLLLSLLATHHPV